MKTDISALKALGNAGISNNMNSILSRCMRDGDAETVSTALRSLRHFECSTERKRSSIAQISLFFFNFQRFPGRQIFRKIIFYFW